MAIGDIIVGIDVSYSRVSLSIGKVDNFNQIQLLATTNKACRPYDKDGNIVEDELVPNLIDVLTEAEEISQLQIKSTYVTIPGEKSNVIHTKKTKETKDKNVGVTSRDVVATIIDAGSIDVPNNQTIIDIIPDQFILDNNMQVEDPVNRKSSKLTLLAQVITADTEYINKIQDLFQEVDLEIDGFAPISLVNRGLFLEPSELKSNIMLVDIGAKTTEIGIFMENSFVYTNTFKLGGDNITNDIAYLFDISLEEAEKLKRDYPLALKSYIENDNNVLLSTSRTISEKQKTVKISDVVEIIEARSEDIFMKINKELKKTGLKNYIDTIVLCGQGIMNIDKADVVCKVVFGMPVKFSTNKLIKTMYPEYYTSYALIRYFTNKPYAKTVSSKVMAKEEKNIFIRILEKIKDFFYS